MVRYHLRNILQGLSGLDLGQHPYDLASHLIDQIGKIGLVTTTLHRGKILLRARANKLNEHFNTLADLSYKPGRFNHEYQRASTPRMTMFYAALIPENLNLGELDNATIVGSLEASKLLRDNKITEGQQVVTFGQWIVTGDIPLITVVYHRDYIAKSNFTKQLYYSYQEFLKKHPSEYYNSLAATTFFADQFSKPDIQVHYDYMLSALFTEMAVKKGYAGVLYPSVRSDGQGFNVAIHPHFANNNLELLNVAERRIYKTPEKVYIDNEMTALVLRNQTTFNLNPVIPQLHHGQQRVFSELAVSSLPYIEN